MPTLDTWTGKLAVLGVLLAVRVALWAKSRRESQKSREASSWGRETLDTMLLMFALVFGLIQPFVAEAYFIPTGSMENTLPTNDRILTSKWIYRFSEPVAGDVVVFAPPAAVLQETGQAMDTRYVKRCIGTPGQSIEIRRNKLFRNGKLTKEPYTLWNDYPGQGFVYDLKIVGDAVYSRRYDLSGQPENWTRNGIAPAPSDQLAISKAKSGKVPNDSLLMLGDHRCNSQDGHVWGFLPRKNVIGKVFAVYWPPTHWGTVDRKSAS